MDNLEYIDQATTPSDVANVKNKGYQTIDGAETASRHSTGEDVFKTAPSKPKVRPKTNGTKKKPKKVKTTATGAETNSTDTNLNSNKMNVCKEPSTPSKETVTVSVKTVTTDTDTTKIVTTTTSLNRYTFTKYFNEDDDGELKPERKIRTHSCSSIPYDNIIENLAPFRKRFNNVQLFPDMVDDKKGIVYIFVV